MENTMPDDCQTIPIGAPGWRMLSERYGCEACLLALAQLGFPVDWAAFCYSPPAPTGPLAPPAVLAEVMAWSGRQTDAITVRSLGVTGGISSPLSPNVEGDSAWYTRHSTYTGSPGRALSALKRWGKRDGATITFESPDVLAPHGHTATRFNGKWCGEDNYPLPRLFARMWRALAAGQVALVALPSGHVVHINARTEEVARD
jgi:hypothetical protein